MKTKRLTLKPLSDKELTDLKNRHIDSPLITAYSEMLDGCMAHPRDRLWYTAWRILLPKGSEIIEIGDIGFKGPPNPKGEVEIFCTVFDEYRGFGYATEALKAMCTWGFSMPRCYFIRARTKKEDLTSEHLLERNGFICLEFGKKGKLWELGRPASATVSAFMCLGMALGAAFGVLFGSFEIGMCIGLFCGITAGVIFDISDQKRRRKGISRAEYKAQHSKRQGNDTQGRQKRKHR